MIVGICATGWIRRRKMKRSVQRVMPSAEICFYRDHKCVMEAAGKKRCDVIMIEIRDGTEMFTIRYLRDYSPKTKIIVYSDDGKYALDLINMGVSGYMTEPLTCEKVRAQMEHLRYA